MKAFLVMLMVSLGVAVHAQPQAPIEWGDVQVVYSNPQWPAAGVTAQGDTIVLHSFRVDTGYYHVALCISGNGGQSWSPWHVFTEERNSSLNSHTAITPWGILCATVHYRPFQTGGLSRSTDLGWTWQDPCSYQPIGGPLVLQGDRLFCRYRASGVKWTLDAGCSFSDSFGTGLPSDAAFESMAAGGGWVHALATRTEHGRGRVLYYTRAPVATGAFEAPRDLLPDIYWTQNGHVECDESGTVMVLAPVNYAPPLPLLTAQMVSISRDYGATWTERDTLTPLESTGFGDEGVWRDGDRWFLAWVDSTTSPGFTDGGIWFKFSANNGRSWYPNQQIEGDTNYLSPIADADVQNSHVRVYSSSQDTVFHSVFVRWEGQLRMDTARPVISNAVGLPVLVERDTTLTLGFSATDNDSLWLAQFVARRIDSGTDSLLIILRRDSLDHFVGEWPVPPDTATWACYYRAEDMWENVSYTPPLGPEEPWILSVGVLSTAPERVFPNRDIRLSLYPNPSNGEITFTVDGSSSGTLIGIEVYDLLGRRVGYVASTSSAGSIQRITWNTTGFDGQPLPSGIYFARLVHSAKPALSRITIVR